MKNHFVIKLFFKSILPIVLLIGGLIVFTSRLPGWSLIIGLPMIVISTVFLIYSYDELSQGFADKEIQEITKCSVCGKLTTRDMDVPKEHTICSTCQINASKVFGKKKNSKLK